MSKTNIDDAFKFINKNRIHYNYTPHTELEKETIVDDYIKKYEAMIKVIVDIGIKSYHIFKMMRTPNEEHMIGGSKFSNLNYQNIYETNKLNFHNLSMIHR